MRPHARDAHGNLEDLKEEYDLSECADAVPAPGNFIVSPWVGGSERNRKIPTARTVYEVESRYFLPKAHEDESLYVALVVRPRTESAAEQAIVCLS